MNKKENESEGALNVFSCLVEGLKFEVMPLQVPPLQASC